VPHIGDIVKDNATVGVNPLYDAKRCAYARDDKRNLVADYRLGVLFQTRIGLVHDEIDTEGRGALHGVLSVVFLQLVRDS
jgi:hypothetical protein